MGEYFLMAISSLFLELKKVEESSARRMYVDHNFVDFLVSVDETCYHYWIFSNSILRLWWDKLIPSRWIRGAPRKGLFRMCEDFPYFSLWFDCVSYAISNFFSKQWLSCYCNNVTFSFSMVFTWYCEFMIYATTFNLLGRVMVLLLCLRSNTICST